MAKAAKKPVRRKSRAKKVKSAPTQISTHVIIEEVDDAPSYYANYAEVACSRNEFALLGVRVPTKPSAENLAEMRDTGSLVLPAEFQIIFPPIVIPGLIQALQKQLEFYENVIGIPLPKPEGKDDANK